MSIRRWVSDRQRLEYRIGRLIDHAKSIPEDNELKSELVRYLCILIASLIEAQCSERIARFISDRSSEEIQEFVSSQLRDIPKTSSNAIRTLFKSFDANRADSWFENLSSENRDALDSIRSNRNHLARGGYVGLSLGTLLSYKRQSDEAIDKLSQYF